MSVMQSRCTRVQPRFSVGFVLINLQFYVYVWQIVACPFVLFLLAIVLFVLPRYTDSEYPFGIYKPFFHYKKTPLQCQSRSRMSPLQNRIAKNGANLFSFLCCVVRFVILRPVLRVSLDCPLLIVPSIFSNVYLVSGIFNKQCIDNLQCIRNISHPNMWFSYHQSCSPF